MDALNSLRVAVVSVYGNEITQRSTYNDIVSNNSTVIYTLPEYFKMQNDEILDMHWSFLLDIDNQLVLNDYVVDTTTKYEKIDEVIKLINEIGESSVTGFDPVILNVSNDGNVLEYINKLYDDSVECVNKIDGHTFSCSYEELPDDVIDDIIEKLKKYQLNL